MRPAASATLVDEARSGEDELDTPVVSEEVMELLIGRALGGNEVGREKLDDDAGTVDRNDADGSAGSKVDD